MFRWYMKKIDDHFIILEGRNRKAPHKYNQPCSEYHWECLKTPKINLTKQFVNIFSLVLSSHDSLLFKGFYKFDRVEIGLKSEAKEVLYSEGKLSLFSVV